MCPLCFSVCLSLPLSKSQGTTVQSTIGFQQEGGRGWDSMAKASRTLVISGSLQGRSDDDGVFMTITSVAFTLSQATF